METKSNESTKPAADATGSGSRQERIVSGLRHRLGITNDVASDEELLEKTKNTLSRAVVDLEIAKADFAKAAMPEVEKMIAEIKKAIAKIRFYR